MIVFERLGGWGLGNSLFQIATTVSIALDNGTTYGFPNDCNFKRVRYDNNSYFKKQLPWIDFSTFGNYVRWGTGDIKYMEPPKFYTNVVVDGFFQSEKYFKHHRQHILDLFDVNEILKEEIKIKYSKILNSNSCALHVRRNDYLHAREMRVLDVDYYKKAINNFDEDTTFVIFSDDINWCKSNFHFIKNKIFIEENNDILELYLMSFFEKIIIANSTFSWWGAWLSKNNTVVMPNPTNNWFSDVFYLEKRNHCIFEDLICENWIVI